LLAAVPLNVPPAAQPPRRPELVPKLCDGITITRSASATPPAHSLPPPGGRLKRHRSPGVVMRWHQRSPPTAASSSYGCSPSAPGNSASPLPSRRSCGPRRWAMNTVWPAWYKVAREWDIITTGRHPPAVSHRSPPKSVNWPYGPGGWPAATRTGHQPAPGWVSSATPPPSPLPAATSQPSSPPFTTLPTPSRASPPKTGKLSARRLRRAPLHSHRSVARQRPDPVPVRAHRLATRPAGPRHLHRRDRRKHPRHQHPRQPRRHHEHPEPLLSQTRALAAQPARNKLTAPQLPALEGRHAAFRPARVSDPRAGHA